MVAIVVLIKTYIKSPVCYELTDICCLYCSSLDFLCSSLIVVSLHRAYVIRPSRPKPI